jgi:hypothetical protein
MSPTNTVLPASAGDAIKIKAYAKTMFSIKTVLPLTTDETKQIKVNSNTMFAIKVVLHLATEETAEIKHDTLTTSSTKQCSLYQMLKQQRDPTQRRLLGRNCCLKRPLGYQINPNI